MFIKNGGEVQRNNTRRHSGITFQATYDYIRYIYLHETRTAQNADYKTITNNFPKCLKKNLRIREPERHTTVK